jgi:hypothetical protein
MDSEPSDRETTARAPRWAKVFGLIALVVIALLVILMLVSGPGGHGPGRHTGGGGAPVGAHP